MKAILKNDAIIDEIETEANLLPLKGEERMAFV